MRASEDLDRAPPSAVAVFPTPSLPALEDLRGSILLKELVAAPEGASDPVLTLPEAVSRAHETLCRVVPTPQLTQALGEALSFLRGALDVLSCSAAYIHGTPGSGKTSFLAVLALLLERGVRGPLEASLGAQLSPLERRRLLAVPVTLLGAESLEAAVLTGYAARVAQMTPAIRAPAFRLGEVALGRAEELRKRAGDEALFAALAASQAERRMRRIEGDWDAQRFAAALEAPPGCVLREQLLADLIAAFLRPYTGSPPGTFLSLEDGLDLAAAHAAALGMESIVLLVDDLSGWLATLNPGLLETESAKLRRLCRPAEPPRPVPVVSFLSREDAPPAVAFELSAGSRRGLVAERLRPWQEELHGIALDEGHLAGIIARRLLTPLSPAARARLGAHSRELLHGFAPETLATLALGTDHVQLPALYPASPALIQCLSALACVLEPRRGPLGLLGQVLASRREDLALGELLAVGDLWDLVATGQAEGAMLQLRVEHACRLWDATLRPLLEQQHGVTLAGLRPADRHTPAGLALLTDARVLRTLLLAAVLPELAALRELTASRLLALNAPAPAVAAADQADALLARCRAWAALVPEIRIDSGATPAMSVRLLRPDVGALVERASIHDSPAACQRKVRELLWQALGKGSHELLWRGRRHRIELLCAPEGGRVDAPPADAACWRIILEYPFADTVAAHDGAPALRAAAGTRTLIWVPQPFSAQTLRALSRLVILERLFESGQDFNILTAHLPVADAEEVRAGARQQHGRLLAEMESALRAAYAGPARPGVDPARVICLKNGFAPRIPAGGGIREALTGLVDQALSHDFPKAPPFPIEITPALLRLVWRQVEKATLSTSLKAPVEESARQVVCAVTAPLGLGLLEVGHLQLHTRWQSPLLTGLDREPALTVRRLRALMDADGATGLTTPLQNLLILTFAATTRRTLQLHGRSFAPTLDLLPDETVVLAEHLPDAALWQEARRRLTVLFGVSVPETCTQTHLALLGQALARAVRALCDPLSHLPGRLEALLAAHGVPAAHAPRLRTARAAQALVDAVTWLSGVEVVQVLATAPIETSEPALAALLAHAPALDAALAAFPTALFLRLRELTDSRHRPGQQILDGLRDALASDEHRMALAPRLQELKKQALALVMQPVGAAEAHAVAGQVLAEGSREQLERDAAQALLAQLSRQLAGGDTLRLTLSWRISERRND